MHVNVRISSIFSQLRLLLFSPSSVSLCVRVPHRLAHISPKARRLAAAVWFSDVLSLSAVLLPFLHSAGGVSDRLCFLLKDTPVERGQEVVVWRLPPPAPGVMHSSSQSNELSAAAHVYV